MENLSLILNRFKANLPQIFPHLPYLQVLPGNATALTEQSEAKTLQVKAPLDSLEVQGIGHIPNPFFHCRMKSLFYSVVIAGSTTTEFGCIFAIFSMWGMNSISFQTHLFPKEQTDQKV